VIVIKNMLGINIVFDNLTTVSISKKSNSLQKFTPVKIKTKKTVLVQCKAAHQVKTFYDAHTTFQNMFKHFLRATQPTLHRCIT